MKVYKRRESNVYHSKKNCNQMKKGFRNIQEWEKDLAEAWDIPGCKDCVG